MDGMRNGAPRSGAKSDAAIEGANRAASAASSLLGVLQTPAANGFLLTQKLAMESARFWARRMRAYADQWETLANCTSATDLAEAGSKFMDRMREDYRSESDTLAEIVIVPNAEPKARPEQPRA